jgi:hypothetical protein
VEQGDGGELDPRKCFDAHNHVRYHACPLSGNSFRVACRAALFGTRSLRDIPQRIHSDAA